MADRAARSLETLRAQINALAPTRSKVSDGGIGDTAHSKRKSDHNPVKGVFYARDFTHDPEHGADMEELYKDLVEAKDPRISYIIWNKTITSGAGGVKPWERRPYSGANGHTHHLHISVKSGIGDSDTSPWNIDLKSSTTGTGKAPGADNAPQDPGNPLLVKGNKGHAVARLQKLLNARGAKPQLLEDQDFGDVTEKALKAFQKSRGLHPDGKCGPYTWDELEKA